MSYPHDPPGKIAALFALVGALGAVPALYWTVLLGMMIIGAFASAEFVGGFGMLGVFAYAMLGFAQLRFYFRRMNGDMRSGAPRWWLSTYCYNLVPLGISLAVFVRDPETAHFIVSVWFAALCSLAVAAYRGEELLLRSERG